MQKLMNDFVSFSLRTFKKATPFSSLEKLKEEINEVEIELCLGKGEKLSDEYVDCIMCLLDSAARVGIMPKDIIKAFNNKLEVNKSRKWIENDDLTYSHVK